MIRKITSFFIFFSLSAGIFLLWIFSFGLQNKIQLEEFLIKFKNNDEIVKIAVNKDKIDKIMAEYEKDERVEYIEPNYLYEASIIPNDDYYSNQWYLKKIKAPNAWNEVDQTGDVVIAIIDSGVQITHPDLKNNIWQNNKEIPRNNIDDDKNGFIDDYRGWDFISNTNDPTPKFDVGFTEAGVLHGTIVAGVAAAEGNNDKGVSGVAWRAKIMALRVLDDKGEGRTSEVIKAIDYAVNNGADVINLSFVGFNYSQGLFNAIERAYKAGVIVIAAAGNEEGEVSGYNLDTTPMYPACMDGENGENMVIGVAATDTLDQKANFSSYGFKCVDISAPGISIFSTSTFSPTNKNNLNNFSDYYDGYWSGTSMATPIVAGAIALIQEANPNLNRDETIEVLLNSTDSIKKLNPSFLGQLGTGRVNLYKAVSNALLRKVDKDVKILVVPLQNHEAEIKITDKDGNVEKEFLAFPEVFKGGAEIIAGDIDGDGQDEIIAGAGNGGGPQIRIFDGQGKVLGQFFAYNENFRGGVHVAVGDVNGDGQDEIIAGAGNGGGPQVRIFDGQGKVLGQFFAYNENFRGGVHVAVGDVNGDGQDEIIAGAGNGGGPQVRIFDGQGKVLGQFFAYNENFRGGVRVAVGNFDKGARNQAKEIITAPGVGGGPHVRIFSKDGVLKKEFFAYGDKFKGGVQVSAGDMDNDGLDEIITGMGPDGLTYVRVFKPEGVFIGSFYAFEKKENVGVGVSVINYEIQ